MNEKLSYIIKITLAIIQISYTEYRLNTTIIKQTARIQK